jgi:hypothetical protein
VKPPVIVNTLLCRSLSPSTRKKFTEDSRCQLLLCRYVGREYGRVVQISFCRHGKVAPWAEGPFSL